MRNSMLVLTKEPVSDDPNAEDMFNAKIVES